MKPRSNVMRFDARGQCDRSLLKLAARPLQLAAVSINLVRKRLLLSAFLEDPTLEGLRTHLAIFEVSGMPFVGFYLQTS